MKFLNILEHKNIFPICLGSDCFGSSLSENDSFKLMDRYFELGGNIIDTARMYADWLPGGSGKSEETIGKWLKTRGLRNKVVLSSKCSHPNIKTMDISRLSLKDIEGDIDKSLIALKTDCIDICFLHRDDRAVLVPEIMESLNLMIKKGKILSFGASNWKTDRIEKAAEYASQKGKKAFVASQIKWSLARTNPDYEEDPTLVEMNPVDYEYYKLKKMCVFAYAPQAKGFFSKLHEFGEAGLSQKAKERYLTSENTALYEKVKAIAEDLNISVTAVILSYLTSNPDFPVLPIIGPKTLDQLNDSMSAVDVYLGAKTLGSLL